MNGDLSRDRHQLDDALLAVVHADAADAWVWLEGELDVLNRAQLTQLIARLHARGHQRVTLDLGAVTLCDAGGLAALAEADRRLSEDGGALVLTAVRPLLARVLAITGLDQHLQVVGVREPVGAEDQK